MQEKIPISQDETGGSLHDKLAKLGADLLVKVLEQLRMELPREFLKMILRPHMGMLNKEMGLIDFSQPAIKIERMIRGLNPWPSAYTKLNGKTLKLWEAQ